MDEEKNIFASGYNTKYCHAWDLEKSSVDIQKQYIYFFVSSYGTTVWVLEKHNPFTILAEINIFVLWCIRLGRKNLIGLNPHTIAILYQYITGIDFIIFTMSYQIALFEEMSTLLVYPG